MFALAIAAHSDGHNNADTTTSSQHKPNLVHNGDGQWVAVSQEEVDLLLDMAEQATVQYPPQKVPGEAEEVYYTGNSDDRQPGVCVFNSRKRAWNTLGGKALAMPE